MARHQSDYNNRQQSSSRSSSNGGSDKQGLQAREYRDRQGQEHHHTKSYMEQHGGSREHSGSRKGSDRSDR